jgi:hypothetical protein
LPPRPSLIPKANGQSNTRLGRRLIRGQLEKEVIKLFASIWLAQEDDGEPRDIDIVNGRAVLEEIAEEEDFDYILTK